MRCDLEGIFEITEQVKFGQANILGYGLQINIQMMMILNEMSCLE